MEVVQVARHATIYGIKVDIHTHRIRQDLESRTEKQRYRHNQLPAQTFTRHLPVLDFSGGTYSSEGLDREIIKCGGWYYNKPEKYLEKNIAYGNTQLLKSVTKIDIR